MSIEEADIGNTMNMNAMLLILFSQLFVVTHCESPRSSKHTDGTRQSKEVARSREWRPATYRGLTVGKSTVADMLVILGKPQWSGPPGDQREDDPDPEVWNEYQAGGDFPGKLTVVIDKRSRIIQRIDLYPEDISKEQAIKYFGDDFITTRYDFDECLSNGESAPLYESPDGEFVSIEYRDRGIAIAVNEQGKINHISYVDKPIGAPSSKCKNQ
jgi:hypothetical protein